MNDDLIDRIANARADADWHVGEGNAEGTYVSLSRDDCTAVAAILAEAYGCALVGKREPNLAETLAILSGAFEGEEA